MNGQEYTACGCWDFGVDLVGGDLQQRFIGGDGVAHLLQPAGDGALCDALTQLGHRDRYRHGRISFISRVRSVLSNVTGTWVDLLACADVKVI